MLRRARFLAFMLAGLLVLGPVSIALLGFDDDIHPSDLGVVLGSQILPDGKPSAGLRARLDEAAALYRQGMFPRILVSGGTGKEGFSEAQSMARYLTARNQIPQQAILLDERGDTTEATALNTAGIMRACRMESALIVTQYYHIARSRLAFEKAGIPVVHSAHAHYFGRRDLYSIPREAIALPVYWLRPFPARTEPAICPPTS